jgi:hypothetical protein
LKNGRPFNSKFEKYFQKLKPIDSKASSIFFDQWFQV